MPPQQTNQYDFIINNNQRPKRGLNLGNSKKSRILVALAGLIILIMVFAVIASLFSKGEQAQVDRLTEVAQAQTEIIRVSAVAKDKAKGQDAINFAFNTELSTQSSRNQIKTLLSKRGVKGKDLDKTLSLSKNSKTDDALAEAEKNNRFDETFLAIMDKQLADYQRLIEIAHENGTKSEKEVLSSSFDSAKNLSTVTAAQKDGQ